jgi:hypothetical protein
MRTAISLSLSLALLGCPTPPTDGTTSPGNQPAAGSPTPPPMSAGGGGDVQPVENPGDVDAKAQVGTYTVANVPGDKLPVPDDTQPSSEEAQVEVKAGAHVFFTGEIVCSDCSPSLVLRVAPFVAPSEDAAEPSDEVTDDDFQPPPYQLAGAGSFSMAVPKYAGKVVLEVLDDRDGNGRPSQGEKFTVLHRQGTLTAGENQSGLKVDFSALPAAPGTPGAAVGGPPPVGEAAPPAGGPPPAEGAPPPAQ